MKEESKVFCVTQTRISQLSSLMSIVSDDKDFNYSVVKLDNGTTVAQIYKTEEYDSEASLGKFLEAQWAGGLTIAVKQRRVFLKLVQSLYTAGVLPSNVKVSTSGVVSIMAQAQGSGSSIPRAGEDDGTPVPQEAKAVVVAAEENGTDRPFYSPTFPADYSPSQRVEALRLRDGRFSFQSATPADFNADALEILAPSIGLWRVPELDDTKALRPDPDSQLATITDLRGKLWWTVQLDDSVIKALADAYDPKMPKLEAEPKRSPRALTTTSSADSAGAKPAAQGKAARAVDPKANVFASHYVSGMSEIITADAAPDRPGFAVIHDAAVMDIGAGVLTILNETRQAGDMLIQPDGDNKDSVRSFASVVSALANHLADEFPGVLFYVSEVGTMPQLPSGVGVYVPHPESILNTIKARVPAFQALSRVKIIEVAKTVTAKLEDAFPNWPRLRRSRTPFELFARAHEPPADLAGVYANIITSIRRVMKNQVLQAAITQFTSAAASTGPSAGDVAGAALHTRKGQKKKKETAQAKKEVAQDTQGVPGKNLQPKRPKQSTSADGKSPSVKQIKGGSRHGDMSVITMVRFEGGVPISTATASIPLTSSDHAVVQRILERYYISGQK